jgi:hypothetical protein
MDNDKINPRQYFIASIYHMRHKVKIGVDACLWIWITQDDLLALTWVQREKLKWNLGQNVVASQYTALEWIEANAVRNEALKVFLDRQDMRFNSKPESRHA